MDFLPESPVYFPIERGRYELGPGLKNFGTDFGNQELDQHLFQLTKDFSRFRANKLHCRQERLSKYLQTQDLNPVAAKQIARFMIDELVQKNPHLFQLIRDENGFELFCRLTEDRIRFSSEYDYQSFHPPHPWDDEILPKTLLDALSLQIQEDIAILEKTESKDWISYLHLSSPSHWSAEDKIGLNFSDVHKPVPGIDLLVKAAHNLTEAMIYKGPFVRFVWSFVTDQRLNHHPIAPEGENPIIWKGRSFQPEKPDSFYLRIERQITWGFPHERASLFTIGLSFIPAEKIKSNPLWRQQLISALKSMTPESRKYKGLEHCFDDLIKYLEH